MAEKDRLSFIAQRDGGDAAYKFAKVTHNKYLECIDMDGREGRKFHHASLPHYKPLFMQSIQCFEEWIERHYFKLTM